MDFLERFLPLVTALVAAVSPIFVAVLANGKKSRDQEKQSSQKTQEMLAGLKTSMDGIGKRLETLEMHSESDYKNILQMQIMSEEMPLEVRLEAGEKYVSHGWNGAIKAKYELLKEEYKEREGT